MRDIRDTIVLNNLTKLSTDERIYIDNLTRFNGAVSKDLEKIKLDKTFISGRKISIIESVEAKYSKMECVSKPVVKVELAENQIYEVETTAKKVNMWKALAIEQMSCCEEYSFVIARMALELFNAMVDKREPNYAYDKNDSDITPLQRVLYDTLGKYIVETVAE